MVSEKICFEILFSLRGRSVTMTRRFNLDVPGKETTETDYTDDSATERDLLRPL